MEAVECGAASLSMILEYYGKYVPLERLRVECDVSRDGSKAVNILKAARNYGFEAKGFKKEPKDLLELPVPFIVFWNFNHFLVVEGFGKNGIVYVNDPAGGKRTISKDEFDLSFTGVVLTFKPTSSFATKDKRPSIIPGLIKRLKGSIPELSIVIIAGILMSVPGLMIPIFSKVYIDNYLIKGMQDWVWPLILIMVATMVVNAGLNYLQQSFLLKIQSSIAIKESSRIFWHIIRLPMEFFNQRMAGEIGNRISLNDGVATVISGQLATNIIGIINIIFYAMLMYYYDALLTTIGVLFVILNIIIFNKIIKNMADRSKKLSIESGKLMGISMGGLQSIETLKASGSEHEFFVKFSANQASMQNATNEMVMLNQSALIIPMLFSSVNISIILILGSFRVMDGYMTIGMLVAFQSLMQSFTSPINNLMSLGATIKNLEGDINYLDDVLKYPIEKKYESTNSHESFDTAKLDGKVELKDVTFGYSKLSSPLIDNFNLVINPGQRVAIVGTSGSGKSTVAKLVSSLYEPINGEIFFDDKKASDIDARLLNNSISMVDQDISLFSGTIKENITLWDDSTTDKDIVNACKDALIHDHIASLPDAYNSNISEGGSNFSGGQKQRLEIARALLTNPSILILDEATSALDPITEMKINENIKKRGCTCIIIAHRLSTIRDADLIVVLKNGKVVQEGTHQSLKDIEGTYARLINE
jgi:NHLM bacteriocin system ABC transporter peptidase/ATP-binding protein